MAFKIWPWYISSNAADAFIKLNIKEDLSETSWRDNTLSELSTVNITAALVAAVASAALSWQDIASAPWTVFATFYISLILSFTAISIGTQQSIVLLRLGSHPEGLKELQDLLKQGPPRAAGAQPRARRVQLYLWQLPVMLLNISILVFIIGVLILIWARAAAGARWNGDMKVAFCTSLAGLFGLGNYIFGVIYLYY